MANNYTLFSVEVVDLTEKEKKWFKEELRGAEEDEFSTAEQLEAWLKEHEADDLDQYPEFNWEFEPDGKKQNLLIFSDENGNLDQVCSLLQRWLKAFHPNESIGVEWAVTCSKMRPGEFGGGAVFITTDKRTYMNSASWLMEARRKWKERKKPCRTGRRSRKAG